MGDKGQVYKKGWDGEYRRAEGLFGPKEADVKIGLLSGEPVPATDFLGNQKRASDGAPLYESAGGSGGGEGALVALIALVVVAAVVVALVVVTAVVIAIVAVIAWWARGLYRSIRRDREAGVIASGSTLAWAGLGTVTAAALLFAAAQYKPPARVAPVAPQEVITQPVPAVRGDPGAAPVGDDPAGGATPSASVAERWAATAVVLADGSVLVVGGTTGGNSDKAVATAQLYVPTAGGWRDAATMGERRSYPAAARLPDGRVLVAGGSRDGAPLASCEIYDPSVDRWSPAAPMTVARSFFDLVDLPDGRLLAAGGGTSGGKHPATKTAEVYDPASGSWSRTGSMTKPRAFAATASLSDGRVIVAGGTPVYFGTISPMRTTEIWDPRTGAWTAGPTMKTRRFYAEAVTVGDTVLVAGGWPDNGRHTPALTSTEVLRPNGSWVSGGTMPTGRAQFVLVGLRGGALAIGGLTGKNNTVVGTTDLFSLDGPGWQAGPALPEPVMWPAAARLPDGRVLVVGGTTHAEGATLTSAWAALDIGR